MGLVLFSDVFTDWYIMAIYFMMIPSIVFAIIGWWLLVEDPVLSFTKKNY